MNSRPAPRLNPATAVIGASFVAAIVVAALLAGNPFGDIGRAYSRLGAAPAMPFRPAAAPAPAWLAILPGANKDAGGQIWAQGKGGAVQACAGCHGDQGQGQDGAANPYLAGQAPEYVAKQLLNYQDGSRQNAVMTGIARALSNREIASLAVYVGGLSARPAPGHADAGPDRGRQLAQVGDDALQVQSCNNCHGLNGAGQGGLLPALAGQPADYTVAQLTAWKGGGRKNDDAGIMQSIAKRLSDEDVKAIGDYYATLK